MPVSIYGDGSISGVSTLSTPLGVVTATTFSGNVTGNLSSSGVSTISQLNVGTGGTVITTTAGGLIGIGTISPNSLLELSTNATSAAGGVTVNNTNAAGYSTLQLKNSGASGKTYTVSVGGNTSGLANEFYVYDDTAAAKRFSIDSSGRVTMPYQPAFCARSTGPGLLSGDVVLNTIILNNGGHYSTSTGNFTAPIAGMYYFSFTGFTQNSSSGSNSVEIRKNGTAVVRTFSSEATGTYRPLAVDCIISLSALDTVRPWAGLEIHANLNPNFSGYLIG